MVAVLGERGTIAYVNPAVRRVLGYSAEEVLGTSILEYLHPEDRDGAALAIGAEYEGRNEVPVMDARVRARDGAWVPLEGKVWLLRGTSPPQLAMIARDLRERPRAQQMLTEREAWARAVLEASPVAIVTLDRQMRVLDWNALAERIYGWTAAEVRGKRHPALPATVDDLALLHEVVESGQPFVDQASLRQRRDGSLLEMGCAIAPIRALDGTVTALVEIAADLTGQRALERQFERAQRLEAIGRIARGVARDIEQTLGLIASNAEALVQSGDVRVAGRAHALLEATRRGSALGAQLASLGERPARGGSGIAVADEVLQGAVEDLEREVRGAMRVHVHLGAEDARVAIAADGMREIVDLLVRNAVEASRTGGAITVRSYVRSLDHAGADAAASVPAGRYVVVEIQDSGPGVSGLALTRAFEPFFTTKDPALHVGLGLARAQSAAQRAGGGVALTNAPTRGALATLYLPVSAAPETDRRRLPRLATSASISEPPSGGTMRALVVETDEKLRAMVRRVLEHEGFEVLLTDSAEGVRRIVETTRVTLLVAGMVLPELTGRELARHSRSLQPALKVLYMSSAGGAGTGALGPQDAMIAKPFTATAFATAVRLLVELPS